MAEHDLMLVEQGECGCQWLVNPLVRGDAWMVLTPERREQINDMMRQLDRWHHDHITAYSSDEANVALERAELDDDGMPMVCPATKPDHIRSFVEILPLYATTPTSGEPTA